MMVFGEPNHQPACWTTIVMVLASIRGIMFSGKGDILAQKSCESPRPQSYKSEMLMGIWRVTGSRRHQTSQVRLCARSHQTCSEASCSFCPVYLKLASTRHALEKSSLDCPCSFCPVYLKLASTRHALEKSSLDCHHHDQAQATVSNPPDPH
eukprot:1143257-Pelagomonas_calceolata.AAC.5